MRKIYIFQPKLPAQLCQSNKFEFKNIPALSQVANEVGQ